MGHHAIASLSVAGAQHWAFTACSAWHWPDHHWQCNWWVALAYSCMSVGKRWTLQATIVTTSNVTTFIDFL